MKKDRWILTVRTWAGILAGSVAIVAAVWLLSVYIHALNIDPDNESQIKILREKAQEDKEAYEILLTELGKLNREAAQRGRVYNTGGLLLLLSFGFFLAWIRWLHPGPGEWTGIPAGCAKHADRWILAIRSWIGIVAGCFAVVAAVWLLSVYIHARIVDPGDAAYVEALKEEGKENAEVNTDTLKPELERQYLGLAQRRWAYDLGGMILLISLGVFVVWIRWIRPGPGEWAGVPGWLSRRISDRVDDVTPKITSLSSPRITTDEAAPSEPSTLPLDLLSVASVQSAALDLAPVETILNTEGRDPEAVIPVLQSIQAQYRYLPDNALQYISREGGIPPAQIAGVSTFYTQFRHKPVGQHLIRVCVGTACHVSGASSIDDELKRCLHLSGNTDTDPSGQFTIEKVACIGSCSLAPIITIDDGIYGHMSALTAEDTLKDFIYSTAAQKNNGNGSHSHKHVLPHRSDPGEDLPDIEIRIGTGSCGVASGALQVRDALEYEIGLTGRKVLIKSVGCRGICHREPLVEIVKNGDSDLFGNVELSDVRRIVRRYIKPRGALRKVRESVKDIRARIADDTTWTPIKERIFDAVPYTGKQVHVVLENCGKINPLFYEDYSRREGMQALEKCLKQLTPAKVIKIIEDSGLRGRGGAGFPTAQKWDITRRASGNPKYVICNGDEGDPGAFMDRAVLEADPFRIIEGMIIAAYAVGASEGFVYVRREYPIAAKHLRSAIQTAKNNGILGKNILGTPFNFELHLREGAGAFVCGEETALIQSLEGKRGMPQPKPPYPAQSGYHAKPTLINNVETLACIPWILRRGAIAFAALGTDKSKGTKVFSLAGKINRGGLIEVPMGITIREIVEDIGGGIKDGRAFKAVLTGGPSGGCIPARLADIRIDYEELAARGAIMGSGGLVVLDDRDCMVDIARYFLRFTQDESCGKCTFCRIGTKRMLEILERICEGAGKQGDIELLEELSLNVKKASLCGLGQTAPNPVLTTLQFFREEYEAHIYEHRCPAAQCKALIRFSILDNCNGCTLCAQACPVGAIIARPYEKHAIDDSICTRCGMCVTACPENAVDVE